MSTYRNPYTGKKQDIDEEQFPASCMREKNDMCLPYDMSAINGLMPNNKIVDYPAPGSIKEGTVEFILWLSAMFYHYHDMSLGERSAIKDYTVCAIGKLFSRYWDRLNQAGISQTSALFYHARLWAEDTKMIVWVVFFQYYSAPNTIKECQGTFSLFEAIIGSIYSDYENLKNTIGLPEYKDLSTIILYNTWGKRLASEIDAIDKSLPLTKADKQKIDVVSNKEYFFRHVYDRVESLSSETSSRAYKAQCEELIILFQDLLRDYIIRLNDYRIFSSETVEFAISEWERSSVNVVTSCFMIQSGFYGSEWLKGNKDVNIPCKDGDNLWTHDKRSEICENLIKWIGQICRECSSSVQEAWPLYPWSNTLKQLRINYDGLYNAMKGLYFNSNDLDLKSFTDCFETAIFYKLVDAVQKRSGEKKDGHKGCVYFLVSVLGYNLGDEWFLHAAESISGKKGEDAKTLMRSHRDTLAQKEFEKILIDIIPNLSIPEKKERTKE